MTDLDDLRLAAHIRHQAWSQLCWWWNPPMRIISGIAHARLVEEFYRNLEERKEE